MPRFAPVMRIVRGGDIANREMKMAKIDQRRD